MWALRGDEEWFRQHLVRGPGAVHIGTTESYWQSPDDLIQALRRAFVEVPMDWHAGPDMVIGQRWLRFCPARDDGVRR